MRHGHTGRVSAVGWRVGSTGTGRVAAGAIGLMVGTLGLMGIGWTTGSAGAATTPAPVALPAVTAPIPAALLGVSCATSVSCESVGGASPSAGPSAPLTERLTGTVWKRQKSPTPSGGASLRSVSCLPSGTYCQAVGVMGADVSLYGEKWNGKHWSATPVPDPTTGVNPVLGGLSCASRTSCVAVGSSIDSSGDHLVFSEVWNGVSWTVVPVPTPAGTVGALLDAVSCVGSPTTCTAVGSYATSTSAGELLLVETWSGSSWTASTPALPLGASSAQLLGVACPTSGACVAVGTLFQSNNGFPLILSGSGSAWTPASTPRLPSGYGGELESVSCGSSSTCMTVGEKSNGSTGTQKTLAEVWKGATWSISAARTVKNAAANLLSVSCASSSACSAVGYAQLSSTGDDATLTEAWNGTTWVVQKTPRA
jgi:hypothetical protein